MEKISVFAPSVMRDKLSVSQYVRTVPDARWNTCSTGGIYLAEEYDSLGDDKTGFPVFNSRRETLISHKRHVSSWFNAILNTCLYADEVWIPSVFLGHSHFTKNDPENTDVEDWFQVPSQRRYETIALHHDYSQAWSEYGAEFRSFFQTIRPLVNAGIIRIYNFALIYMEQVSEPLLGEKRWMTEHEISNSYPDLFVAEGLLFAKALGVPYTATRMEEIDAINNSAKRAGELLQTDRNAVTLLSEATMPGLELSPDNIVKARMDNEAFEDFRSVIRRVSRDLPRLVGSQDALKEIELLERDLLHPEIQRLNSQVSKSGVLARNLKPNAISFTAGALASLALKADPTTAIASGALTTLGRVILTEIFDRQELDPEARFISHLRAS